MISAPAKPSWPARLLEKLEQDSQYEATLLVIVHSEISAEWMLKKIAHQLGVDAPGETKGEVISQLYERLMKIYEEGRKAVVLIDEANMLQKKGDLLRSFAGF